jgi:hypothetical protein
MDRAVKAQLQALRSASNAILAVHVIKTLFALLVLGRFGLSLAHTAEGGDLIRVLSHAIEDAWSQAAPAQWTICAYALLGPLLTQLVLAALLTRQHAYLAAGSRYGRALLLSAARIAALGAAGMGGFAASVELASRVGPQLELAVRITALTLSAVLAAWLITVHDLASAQLARDERPSLRNALTSGVRASSPLATLVQVGFGTAALLAFVLGDAAGRRLGWPAAALAVTQIAALATTFIHAWWLKIALELISRR